MSDRLTERLNKILLRVTSDDFLHGRGIGNEIAFYIFDYPPEDELRVRDHIDFLVERFSEAGGRPAVVWNGATGEGRSAV